MMNYTKNVRITPGAVRTCNTNRKKHPLVHWGSTLQVIEKVHV